MIPTPNRGKQNLVGALLLIDKYYKAKQAYYKGKPDLTDAEFDAMESSIKAIDGQQWFDYWSTPGYDPSRHAQLKRWLLTQS